MQANAENNSFFTEVFDSEGSSFGLSVKSLLHDKQSTYQRIEIFDTTHFGKLMVLDGCIMLTQRDNFIYHEMMSHPALFSHPQPENVVIIGGGDCGTLKEVLKHPEVKMALQVELDEEVTRVSERFFPELCEKNNDPRAHFYFGDGIRWIADAEPASLDLIIIDSTDPVGPAEGLFSVPFYRDCFNALKPNGIIVQQSESPIYHSRSIIAKMNTDLRTAGFSSPTLRTFPQPVYPSGWWSCTMAVKVDKASTLELNGKPLRAVCIESKYYTQALHSASSCLPAFMSQPD
ncbi:MAG: polyamine aminopropyltransferase [Gammaproteobacteria bacterium]|nr:polyamine aminopropyltransferase [Gammaproteobacteria bacterium]